jgi:hypothetical protein
MKPGGIAIGVAAAALLVSGATVPASASPADEAGVSARSAGLTMYPLQARSVAAQLSARNRAKLPKANRWASRILAPVMDQPAGLTEVQMVSALHIRRIFRKRLGASAAKGALRISWRESRLLPNVVNDTNRNKTNDWGLFQLNDGGTLQYAGGVPGVSALRPKWNVRAAVRLIEGAGWAPWGGMPTR